MSRALFIVPAALLLIALVPLPYGYYQFLRLVIFLAGGWVGSQFWARRRTVLAVPFILLAALFNPIFPIHLTRETWMAINVGATALFGIGMRAWSWEAPTASDTTRS